MLAVITLLIVVTVTLIVTRVATIALALTGMSKEAARFQARSALTGTGFTTSEAESVVAHPVRRRIVMAMMLLGSAGLVTAVGTLLLSFSGAQSAGEGVRRALILLGGLALVLWLSRSRVADRVLTRIIERLLRRIARLEVRDYASLLRLAEEWMVAELEIEPGDWVAERSLAELDLPHEGILVLGIERADGRYVGAPKGSATLHAGDVAVLYGRREHIDALDVRPRGVAGDHDRDALRARYEQEIAEQERAEHPVEGGEDPTSARG
jgi:hypothetical protein